MSWFLGVWHKRVEDGTRLLNKSTIVHENLEIEFGGHSETIHANCNNDNGAGWIVCGNGIEFSDGGSSLLSAKDWQERFHSEVPSLPTDGHYAIVYWTKFGFTLYTDKLELRRVYVVEDDNNLYFSTDLYKLTQFVAAPNVNMSSLASQLMMINSFSGESLLHNVLRLGASGVFSYHNGVTKHMSQDWLPGDDRYSSSAKDMLEDFSLLPFNEGKDVCLGLSGGVDCRTILAILLRHNPDKTSLFSFGETTSPDFQIAKEISERLHIFGHFVDLYTEYPLKPELLFNQMESYSLITEGAAKFDNIIHSYLFSQIGQQGSWMLDGGEGELFRMAFGNKIIRQNLAEWKTKNAGALLPFFTKKRFLNFAPDIETQFAEANIAAFESAINSLPNYRDFAPQDLFNIFTIRNRVRNLPPNGQKIADSYTLNHMPFAQPTLLSKLCYSPLNEKENSALARRIIIENCPALNEIPYLRRGVRAPFWLMDHFYPMLGYAKILKKIKPPKLPEPFIYSVLRSMRELLLDRVRSIGVQQCGWYDKSSLQKIEQHLEGGELTSSGQSNAVLEWLQFDIWREHLKLS